MTELLILAELVELVELDGSAELAELVVDRPRDVTTVRRAVRGDLRGGLFLVSFGAFFECQ